VHRKAAIQLIWQDAGIIWHPWIDRLKCIDVDDNGRPATDIEIEMLKEIPEIAELEPNKADAFPRIYILPSMNRSMSLAPIGLILSSDPSKSSSAKPLMFLVHSPSEMLAAR